MKTAIAQCPMVGETDTQPRQEAGSVTQPSATTKSNAQTVAYTAKSIVIFSGVGIMYFLINYGRVFQNYLRW